MSPTPSRARLVLSVAREALADRDAALLFLAAIAFYAFFYAWPYENQLVRHIPVVVADLDGSPASRRVIREIDASPAVDVVGVVSDEARARSALQTERASVILIIPTRFERDLLAGRDTVIAALGDGAYPVKVRAALAGVTGPLTEELARADARQLALAGIPLSTLARVADQGPAIIVQPVFNLVPGYAQYAVPLVSVVILQSIMLMGITLALGGWLDARARPEHLTQALASPANLAALVGGFALIVLVWALFLEGFAFWWHDFASVRNFEATLLVSVLLAVAIAALGVALSLALGSGAYAMQVVVVTSVPAVFISGAIYPWENMPAWAQLLAQTLPSTPGIRGMLAASQMGAPLSAVLPSALHLGLLALAYFALACFLARYRRAHPAPGPD